MPRTTSKPVVCTWTSASATSDATHIGDAAVLALELPATFTGTTLAIHGCSTSGGTFAALQDAAATVVSITVAADKRIYLDPVITAGWPWIKLVSGASEAAGRTVNLMTRPV
jgi:hypothetical protein